MFEYESDKATIKEALTSAVKEGADLRFANLEGANIEDAYLEVADLRGADLDSAYM